MNAAALFALPLGSCVLAFVSWALEVTRPRAWLFKPALVAQACFGLFLSFFTVSSLSAVGSPSVENGIHDAAGVWLSVGDLFVELAFELRPLQGLVALLVLLGTSGCLWWSRHEGGRVFALLGLQGALWLCLFGSDLPVSTAGFVLAGYLLPHVQSGTVRLQLPLVLPGLHRTADGFAVSSIVVWLLWSPALSATAALKLQLETDDSVMIPIAGMSATACLVLLLSFALAFRVFAAFTPRVRDRGAVVAGAMVAAVSCLWANSLVPGRFTFVLILSSFLGLAFAYVAGTFVVSTRLLPAILRGFRGIGLVVSVIARWGFSGVLLQAPVVAVDASSRLIKLFAGGDIQRYVAIGIIGLASLVFVATRPAAPTALSIQTDGLRVRADAQRGALSSSRLLYDYDFDGDDQVDRASVGSSAGFTYAAAGTYSIAVTIRDPFWHTQRTLRAKVQVKP